MGTIANDILQDHLDHLGRSEECDEAEIECPICRYCGSREVYWAHKRGIWWLENYSDGSKHHCVSQQALLNDFEIIS
jgi:hypothetical protein